MFFLLIILPGLSVSKNSGVISFENLKKTKTKKFSASTRRVVEFFYVFDQRKNGIGVKIFGNRIFRINGVERKLFWWFVRLFKIF